MAEVPRQVEELSADPEEMPDISIEGVFGLDEEILQQVVQMENASFPEGMKADQEDLKEILDNPNGFHFLIRDSGGKIVGYLASLRQTEEYEDLKKYDPLIENTPDSLYIESIAIEPSKQRDKIATHALQVLRAQAVASGYKKISMHARIKSGFSEMMQKKFGARQLRKLENWYDFGEPFDYLEMDLLKNKN